MTTELSAANQVAQASQFTASSLTAVDYEATPGFIPLLRQLGISLIISTYQAGKVISVGSSIQGIQIHFHHFEQAMGIARTPTGLAIGSKRQVWNLQAAPHVASKMDPTGSQDIAFLTRSSHFTGSIMSHDLAWAGGELWVVNTLFSCLCVLKTDVSFAPRWRPPFITALASEDRCHLNGLAVDENGPRFVTALGMTDSPAGWRPGKSKGGCLIDVGTEEIVLQGLSMPHSPRLHHGELFFLDSGNGAICRFDPSAKTKTVIVDVPGYARGMDFHGRFAFVGLSRIRETSVFGGLPIAERQSELRCGVAVVDLVASKTVATLLFTSGVEEIFEVKVLPGYRNPILSGPYPETDQTETLWLVPPETSN